MRTHMRMDMRTHMHMLCARACTCYAQARAPASMWTPAEYPWMAGQGNNSSLCNVPQARILLILQGTALPPF